MQLLGIFSRRKPAAQSEAANTMADTYPLPISARYFPGIKLYHDADDYFAKEGKYPDAFDVSKPVKRWIADGSSFQIPSSETPGGLVTISVDGHSLNLPGPHTNIVNPPYTPPNTQGTYDTGAGNKGIIPPSVLARTSDVQLLVARLGNGADFVDQDVINPSNGMVEKVSYTGDDARYYAVRAGSMIIPAVQLVHEMYQHGVNSPGHYSLSNGHLIVSPVPTEPVPGGPPEVPIPVQLHDGEILKFGFAGIPTVQLPDTSAPQPPAGGATPPVDLSGIEATLFQIQQAQMQILALLQAKGGTQ